MNRPLVSILVPSYNLGRYLPETCRSIQAQSYPHWEALIGDDGSDPSVAGVVAPFLKDERFSFVEWRPNRGVHAAIHYLYTQARGDFWCPFSSDDLLEPDFIEARLAAMARHPRAALIQGPTILVDENGATMAGYRYPFDVPPVMDGCRALELLLQHNFVCGAATMIRASIARMILPWYTPEWRYTQDWLMWILLAATGFDFIWEHRPLVRYRVRAGSLGHPVEMTAANATELRLLPLWAFSRAAQFSPDAARLWRRWRDALYHLWLRRVCRWQGGRAVPDDGLQLAAHCYYGGGRGRVTLAGELLRHGAAMWATSRWDRAVRRRQKHACCGLALLDDAMYRA